MLLHEPASPFTHSHAGFSSRSLRVRHPKCSSHAHGWGCCSEHNRESPYPPLSADIGRARRRSTLQSIPRSVTGRLRGAGSGDDVSGANSALLSSTDRKCWMFDRKKISVDVDVVLTCYKRPNILRQQLDAIKAQTLAPRRIFLYQDGIDGYYKIELNDRILSDFDACKISATNGGVWKRFEFAEEICKSPYVCIFDDDTIPGARWLENCHVNMMQQRGVYVTNGVLLGDAVSYPNNDLSVGWHVPNKKTAAVDFGGHSWFFERDCLNLMLAKPWRSKYKLVGEDMTISFAAQEHGIGTYAPQHPVGILSLWGSQPEFGWKYGGDESAVHKNPANMEMMNRALAEICSNGWRLVLEENPDYLNELSTALEHVVTSADKNFYLKMLQNVVKNLLPFFGQRPPIFLGERKCLTQIQNLFGLRTEDYHVLENDRNEIETERLFEILRQGAIHIFFTDAYDELKPT